MFEILAFQPKHSLTREAGLDEGSEEHLPEFGKFPLEEPWLGGRHRVVAPGPVGLMVPVRDGWNRVRRQERVWGDTSTVCFFKNGCKKKHLEIFPKEKNAMAQKPVRLSCTRTSLGKLRWTQTLFEKRY